MSTVRKCQQSICQSINLQCMCQGIVNSLFYPFAVYMSKNWQEFSMFISLQIDANALESLSIVYRFAVIMSFCLQ